MKFHGKKNLHGIPWNSLEFHERKKKPPRIFMEFHVPNPDRILWSSMENSQWNSMEFHGVILHGEGHGRGYCKVQTKNK